MSVFSVLKYPISDRPTTEEFEALPEHIFHTWYLKSSWAAEDPINLKTPAALGWYYTHYPKSEFFLKQQNEDIALLKKIVREMK